MTNNNTMSKGYCLFEHIFWGILTLIWFNNILFRNIEGLTYDQSRHFLWCTIILSLTVGAAITWKKRRNNLSLFVNVIIPYELYSLIAYDHTVCIFTWSLKLRNPAFDCLASCDYCSLKFLDTPPEGWIHRSDMR